MKYQDLELQNMDNLFSTQGPWEAHQDNNDEYWDIDGERRISSVSVLGNIEQGGSAREAKANAVLIAAAPDMLWELDDVAHQIQLVLDYDMDDEAKERLKNTIKNIQKVMHLALTGKRD